MQTVKKKLVCHVVRENQAHLQSPLIMVCWSVSSLVSFIPKAKKENSWIHLYMDAIPILYRHESSVTSWDDMALHRTDKARGGVAWTMADALAKTRWKHGREDHHLWIVWCCKEP